KNVTPRDLWLKGKCSRSAHTQYYLGHLNKKNLKNHEVNVQCLAKVFGPLELCDLLPVNLWNLWKELKTAVHKCSPSNLTELELFCKEEWEKMSVSRCAKLIETYPKRLTAVIAAKGGATKY
uniref:Uncharacterized protein n=1 Tax=Oncorhynchus tshawytscha TaxID=74940 RepID=A0AAZ3QJC0_ONCTS